jgi:hypothetical protein
MPQTVLDAAYNVVHDYPGGAPSLAPRIGKNATTLAHECNGTGAAKLGLADAVKLTQRSGDMRILLAFATACGQMCLPLPETLSGSADDCMQALAASSREFAELMNEVLQARSDGHTSDNELDNVLRGGGELIRAIHGLQAAFIASNSAGKPPASRLRGVA